MLTLPLILLMGLALLPGHVLRATESIEPARPNQPAHVEPSDRSAKQSQSAQPAQANQRDADASTEDQNTWKSAGWGSESSNAAEDIADNTAENTVEGLSQDKLGKSILESGFEGLGDVEMPKPDSGQDWSQWEATDKEHNTNEATSDFDHKVKVGDILGGSLRLTGSFLDFDDLPTLFPQGDDALVLTVGRLLLEADVGKHLHVSFNGFGELGRLPGGSGLNGTFASAGNTVSAYRTRYLNWKFWEPASLGMDGTVNGSGSVSGQLGVDRASIRLSFNSINIDLGRFPISYTVASMFTTNDFFAPFSATAVNSIYKPGVDSLRVSAGVGPSSSVDVMGVLGYNAPSCNPDADPNFVPSHFCFDAPNRPSWRRSAVFSRAATVRGGFEWAVLGGKVSERWVAGGSFQGDAGPINLRGEFHVGVPQQHHPDSRRNLRQGSGRDGKAIYGRASAGMSLQFAWHNAAMTAEYLFASDGAKSSSDLVSRALNPYSDDLPYFGRHYVGGAMGMEIIPILRVTATGIVSGVDGSGLAGLSFAYNVADESDLILGVFVPWGKGYRGIDPTTTLPVLGSEFGLSPLTAYLEARVFF